MPVATHDPEKLTDFSDKIMRIGEEMGARSIQCEAVLL